MGAAVEVVVVVVVVVTGKPLMSNPPQLVDVELKVALPNVDIPNLGGHEIL